MKESNNCPIPYNVMEHRTQTKLNEVNKMEQQNEQIKEERIEQINEQTTQQAIEDLKVFDSNKDGTDLTEFEGTRVKIERVEIIDSISSYTEQGKYQEGLQRPVKKIKVVTAPVTQIEIEKEEDKKSIDICASELFNMTQRDGQWGISSHPKAAIQKFLLRQKVNEVKDLIGTMVTVKAVENKDGKVFLGFITE